MAKVVSNFVCQQCGYVSPQFLGKCPECNSWNSLVETVVKGESQKGGKTERNKTNPVKTIKLSEIEGKKIVRMSTGIEELDQVLGGGIVSGMAILVAGEPGIGKSTLLLELARNWVNSKSEIRNPKQNSKDENSKNISNFELRDSNFVLYIAGEESASQIKIRAQRLGIMTDKIVIAETTDVDEITSLISSEIKGANWLVIVDSIQTLTTSDLTGTAGTVGQVRECAARIIAATKPMGLPLFLVGHVTKEGTIAGPKVLEHIVDTVLTIEGDKYNGLRLLRTNKNRFGPTDEVGVFTMTDSGLTPVIDPSGLFTDMESKNKEGESGSCLTVTLEGTRPMLAEVQALVTSTPLPNPRRVASGVDYNRLQTIVAILQKRLNLPLYKEDVYVSVSGGLKIDEPAADLAIALSILSSFQNKPLEKGTVAIGELDLLGNIRRVNSLEKRIKEGKRLGFNKILSPENLASIRNFKL